MLIVAGLLMAGALNLRQRPRESRAPMMIPPPFTGRWTAFNSPSTKVPSHTHSYAQTYAIDVKHDPRPDGEEDGEGGVLGASATPPVTWFWPLARRPQAYPSFGRPVLAPAGGVVVATAGEQRDHLTRTSLPGVLFLGLEGFVRGLGWPRHLLGNHVVLDMGEGVHAVFAHLRRGSLRVSPGDRVPAGAQLADCGNSGNSSDPHLHFQLMDGPDVAVAHGLPFEWRYTDDDGNEHTGVPANFTSFVPVRPS
ncbi:peptidase M23 [Streptomyces abyssalis]|uniref:Peptidase M23 n=1 Tax=Streptomyces abyssalis TaxID=933944 RepID=A0A1E7JIU0_9ACTN|nr:peptidase M23 [Streptomyces abyssalis]OEU93276.1 peptidase M23 [Streptomyces abyssalis]